MNSLSLKAALNRESSETLTSFRLGLANRGSVCIAVNRGSVVTGPPAGARSPFPGFDMGEEVPEEIRHSTFRNDRRRVNFEMDGTLSDTAGEIK
jgi:hypothetical protein